MARLVHLTAMPKAAVKVPQAPHALLRGPLRDLANRVQLGSDAPRAQERIWIDPSRLSRIYTRNPATTPDFRRRHSGMVIGGDWDRHIEPLDRSWKIAACLAHFRNGVPWAQTKAFPKMQAMIALRGSFDSCRTDQDIRDRYARIDTLFADIERNGYRDETVWRFGAPRLPEGVFVHIDRNGAPIFGAIGNHRMGIARALGLTRIPAQLGVVHPEAFAAGALARYRDGAA
ncbi:hypothetical protein [Marivita sp. GX14005]|uniref:hypothetical protein n=1 Tax=Marivita sp. GX14005 TaxID=2942276 RepID=UPI002018A875|nr:hypothetical protein [Marivita sp. GX14005]MCL3882628.1 hypothetical protein [Marivita sp. GX14005]